MAANALPTYPWYGLVSGADLEQGDVLLNCPVFLIPADAAHDPANLTITIQRQNVIVLSQSCDLTVKPDGRSAIDEVILSPFYTRQELAGHKVYGKPQGWEEARKGRHAGYHVLNRCDLPGHELDFLLVDLRRIFTLTIGLVREFAQTQGLRIRLLPPYREHLSQAFARFFMRVGLPVDIPAFR
jgi:hypothetical protein